MTELETIIAGATYDAPPGGWPPMARDQTGCGSGDATRVYISTSSKGAGYYTLRAYVDHPLLAPRSAPPYDGIGLLAALFATTLDEQVFRDLADKAGGQEAANQ